MLGRAKISPSATTHTSQQDFICKLLFILPAYIIFILTTSVIRRVSITVNTDTSQCQRQAFGHIRKEEEVNDLGSSTDFCTSSAQFNLKFNLKFWQMTTSIEIFSILVKHSCPMTCSFYCTSFSLLAVLYSCFRIYKLTKLIFIKTFYEVIADFHHKQRVCCRSKASSWDLKRVLTSWWLENTEISLLIPLSAQHRPVWVAKCSGSGGIALQ